MTPLQWVRTAAAFSLIALGIVGLFVPYPAVGDPAMAGALAMVFITTGVGALGIKLAVHLTNRRNGQ